MEAAADRGRRNIEGDGHFGGCQLFPGHEQQDFTALIPEPHQRRLQSGSEACGLQAIVYVGPRIAVGFQRRSRLISKEPPMSSEAVAGDPVQPWSRARPPRVVAAARPPRSKPHIGQKIISDLAASASGEIRIHRLAVLVDQTRELGPIPVHRPPHRVIVWVHLHPFDCLPPRYCAFQPWASPWFRGILEESCPDTRPSESVLARRSGFGQPVDIESDDGSDSTYLPAAGFDVARTPEELEEAFAWLPERIVELRQRRASAPLNFTEQEELRASEKILRRSAPWLLPPD